MKGLFCYDGPISRDQEGNYYAVALNNEVLSRYYYIADELKLLIRVKDVDDKKILSGLSRIKLDNLSVKKCCNLSSVKGLLIDKFKAKKILENEIKNTDFLIVRLPSFIGNLSIDVAQKLGKPYLIEVVGCPWDSLYNMGIKGKMIAPYMKIATKKRVNEAPYVVYVTNEFLQKRYPTEGKNTNCSNVALKEFDDDILKKRIEKINSRSEKIIIGTTAAVNVKFKGQQYIIRALARLKERGFTNYEYQLVGAGDQSYLRAEAIKYGVENQVKFLGAIPHKKVFDWLDTIDIYAQPSRQEGLPRALIEAMSRGIPSIGARTAGIPELLEDKYIFSNTNKNIEEICDIMIKLNTEKMLNQSQRNYKESKKYSKEIIEERRKKFFKEFIEGINK